MKISSKDVSINVVRKRAKQILGKVAMEIDPLEEKKNLTLKSNLSPAVRIIKDLCLIPGLSGYEDNVRKYLENKLYENKFEYSSDVLGNLICTLPGKKNLPSVMLFAHMDQLGFIVKKIENNGFIKVERLGGVPEKSLASQEVTIKSEDGKYFNGIIGNKSHHATLVEEKYKVISYRDLYIDAGFSSKNEVIQNNINIGCPITYAPYFNTIGKYNLIGTSIDDRAGCAVIFEVAKKIKNNVNRPTVHIVFSVQEEFNLRGVLPTAQKLKPDIAIQIDLMLSSDTPDMENQGDVFLGKGPCMSMYSFHGRGTLNGLLPHPNLVNLFKVVSKKYNINLQKSATTGVLTDSSYVQLVDKGVATIDMGFPIRYSHSSREVCDLRDLTDLEILLTKAITSIDKKFSLKRK
ncbi:M42 family metallopeptidase [Alphaproteobacteria bacterium]|nr:M42 family metallopeptidase [Alphaproteobacteria bacterium]